MIKVVLDTKVVISSAISSDGNPARILDMIFLEKIKNYTNNEIVEEINDVIARKRISEHLNKNQKDLILNTYLVFLELVESTEKINAVQEDADDNKFLECAISAKADYVISEDSHLLKLKEFRGIKILSPAEFVKTVE